MALAGKGSGFYAKAEDAYYSFLDKLDSKGIPVYGIVDPIEAQNIPSFPIFLLLCVVALAGIALFASSALGAYGSLEVLVQDGEGNPVRGAALRALADGKEIDLQTANLQGKAVVKVPLGREVELRASKEGYAESRLSAIAEKDADSRTITLSKEATTITKSITFLRPGTTRLYEDPVEVEFSCTASSFTKKQTVSGGKADVVVSSDCDTLIVKASGRHSISGGPILLASENQPSVFVTEGTSAKGSVVVSVADSKGSMAEGVSVTLWNTTDASATGAVIGTKDSSTAGTATFDFVPVGKYYVVTYDRNSKYAEYDGLSARAIAEVKEGEITTFAVALSESVAGRIKLRVKDKATGDPVAQAVIALSKGQTIISSLTTNAAGEAEFNVGEDVEYSILIDKQGYLISSIKAKPSADFILASIEQATAENSESLLVNVVDEKEKPVENVRLRLKNNSDGTQAGSELVTGIDGRGIFERVGEGAYYVYAVKPGYGEKTSETFNVSNRQQNILKIKIAVGTGRIDTIVVDEDGKPVAGASIRAVDYGAFLAMEEATADSDGKKSISARADKQVFLIVSADGYLPTTTVPLQMQKDVAVEKKVVLSKPSQSFAVKFDGLYSGTESVSAASGVLNPGSTYTARLRMVVPKSSSFDEAGVYIRTGKEQNNSVEKDPLNINAVRAAYSALFEGTTYTPPAGQAIDMQHTTSGDAKWANIVFKKAGGGVYEAEADISVKDEAKIGSLLEISYRAYGKSGGYVRSPLDSALGTSESMGQKQGLYANTLKRSYSVGPTSLCGEDFCAGFSIEDISEKITTGVVDSYSGQVGGKYRLLFEASSISESPFSASQLSIKDRTSSISIQSYKVKTASGDEKSGQNSASEVSVSVGELSKDSVVAGEISFEAKKDGTVPLDITITSGSGTVSEVYRKTIYIKALAAKKLNIDVLPKVIVPLINNNILVRVTDAESSSPVANAKVALLKDGEAVAGGETDIDGIFAYTLLSPSDASTIGFSADKTGYRATGQEMKVSGNILATSPANLRLSINVGAKEYNTIDAELMNYSQVPLQVEKITISRDFDGFAEIRFTEPSEGTVMAPDGNLSLSGTIRLGPKGVSISKPQIIKGAIGVEVTNSSIDYTWVALIPFELGIGFGDEVDDPECFTVSPSEWKIFGSTKDNRELTVSVINSCMVGGEKVSLRNLSIRVVPTGENPLGTFRATSTIEGSRPVQLDKTLRPIAEILPNEGDSTIKLEFRPEQVMSSKADSKIELQATHLTAHGDQKLTRKMDVSVNINNLNECLEILTNRDITVQSCPYGTGFGNYGNYFSSYSNSRYSAYDPYAVRNGYGTGVPPYIGSQYQSAMPGSSYYDYSNPASAGYQSGYYNSYYPNSQYAAPYYPSSVPAEGMSGNFGSSWNCGTGGFTVRNSCSAPVELSLDSQPGIIVRNRTQKIEPGAQGDVLIEPTNFFGRYALGVKAKVAGSSQPSIDLRTMYVNVTNEFAKNYKDCISVSPSRTLSFNNFIGKPVVLTVYNSCYDQGVFLEATNNAVMFTNSAISNPSDPFNSPLGTSGAKQPMTTAGAAAQYNPPGTGTGPTGPINMIQDWALLGETTTSSANGKVVQQLEFEVVKNLSEYRNRAPPANFFSANAFANIGNLRYFATSGYYAVQGRTNLIVRFSTPSGGMKTTYFPMIIQDFWPLLEYAERLNEQFTTFGDPRFQPNNCINNSALDFRSLGDLPLQQYSTKENGGLFIIKEQGGCGTVDTISEPFNPAEFVDPKSGLRMTVTHDGHEATLTFDDSKWNGKRAEFINVSTISKVSRIAPAGTQIHRFPVNIYIKARDGTAAGPVTGGVAQQYSYACREGETGQSVYTKYGFQHLKLDWRVPGSGNDAGIQKDACDVLAASGSMRSLNDPAAFAAPAFCDGVQASLALTQKISEIKKLAAVLGADSNGQIGTCRPGAGFVCNKDKISSEDMYRYVLMQNKDYAYFLGSDGRVIDLVPLLDERQLGNEPQVKEMKANIAALRSTTPSATDSAHNLTKIIPNGNAAMGKLSELVAAGARFEGAQVVLEVNTDSIDASILPNRKVGDKWYVVGMADYRSLHDNIVSAIGAGKCTDTSCMINGKTITASFLTVLVQNGKWKLTAMNAATLSPAVKALVEKGSVLSEAAKKSVDAVKYRSFADFERSNISPRMYLATDKYDPALWQNFKGSYPDFISQKGIGDVEVSFAQTTQISESSGDYNVLIGYTWAPANTGGTQAANISFKRNRTLKDIDTDNRAAGFASEYEKNVLLTIPFDNAVNAGANISGPNSELLHFNKYSDTDAKLTQARKEQYDNASMPITFIYSNSYDSARRGRIISVSRGAITYSPTDPIKVMATIVKGTQLNPAGVLFEFKSLENGMPRTFPLLLPMKAASSGIGKSAGDIITTAQYKGSALCSERADLEKEYSGIVFGEAPVPAAPAARQPTQYPPQGYGQPNQYPAGQYQPPAVPPQAPIAASGQETGTLTLEGIIFTPTRTAEASGSSMSGISIRCAKESGSAISSQDPIDGTIITPSASMFGQIVELNRRRGGLLTNDYTLKSLLEKIRAGDNGQVCVKADAEALELFWNEGAFLK